LDALNETILTTDLTDHRPGRPARPVRGDRPAGPVAAAARRRWPDHHRSPRDGPSTAHFRGSRMGNLDRTHPLPTWESYSMP